MFKFNILAALFLISYIAISCGALKCYSCEWCSEHERSDEVTCKEGQTICMKSVISKEVNGKRVSLVFRSCLESEYEECDKKAQDLLADIRSNFGPLEQEMFDAQKPFANCTVCKTDLCNGF